MSSKLDPMLTWMADGCPIPISFLQGLASEDELKKLTATAKQDPVGLIPVKSKGKAAESTLSDLVVHLDKWLEPDPYDPRFWRTHYEPMRGHIMSIAGHAKAKDQGQLVVSMLTRLAIYLGLAMQFEGAIEAATLASELAKKHFGKESEAYAATLIPLANAVRECDSKSKAQKLLKESLKIREKLFGRRSLPVSDTLLHLGNLGHQQLNIESAFDYHELSVEIREKLLPADHLDLAASLDAFGLSNIYMERFEGVEFTERAYAIRERLLPEDHPWLAESLNNLALFYEEIKPDADFEGMYRRCLSISEKWYGPVHVEIATHAENLALLLKETGQKEEAESLFRRVVAMKEQLHGANSEDLPGSIHELAEFLCDSGRHEEAVQWIERGLSIMREWQDNDDAKRMLLCQFGHRYLEIGEQVEAIALYEEALALAEDSEEPEWIVNLLSNQSLAFKAIGETEKAKERLNSALEIARREFGKNSLQVSELLLEQRTLHLESGEKQEELSVTRDSLAVIKKLHKSEPLKIADAHLRMGISLGRNTLHKEAETHLRTTLELYEKHEGYDHPETATVMCTLGHCLVYCDPEAALDVLKTALAILQKAHGNESSKLYYCYGCMAEAYVELGQFAPCLQSIERCLQLRFANDPDEDEHQDEEEPGQHEFQLLKEAQEALREERFETTREHIATLIRMLG